jgi:hypothetical protein
MDRADASPARIYRRLLQLYPSAFRERYADEMAQLFEDQLRDVRASGAPVGTVRLWLRVLGDLAMTAASEHAGRDRTVAHSLTTAPSTSSRALGLVGILGGLVLVVPIVGLLPPPGVNQIRLILFCVGSMAVIIAVHRRQAPAGRRLALSGAVPAILANAWYVAMVVLMIGRDSPFGGDFGAVLFAAGVALWLTDAWFGAVTMRLGVVSRWAATVLTVGSLLALLGIDRLGLVDGPLAELVQPLALLGIVLNGIGWILLGLDLALRRRPRVVPAGLEPPADRPPGT